jgi:hypothetical protein
MTMRSVFNFFIHMHAPSVRLACPITVEKWIALLNLMIDFSKFETSVKNLMDKYLKFQRAVMHCISHFLPCI